MAAELEVHRTLKLVGGTDATDAGRECYTLPEEVVSDIVRLASSTQEIVDIGEARTLRGVSAMVLGLKLDANVTVADALRVLAGDDCGVPSSEAQRHQWVRQLLGMGVSSAFHAARVSGIYGFVHSPELLARCVPSLKPHAKLLHRLAFRDLDQ